MGSDLIALAGCPKARFVSGVSGFGVGVGVGVALGVAVGVCVGVGVVVGVPVGVGVGAGVHVSGGVDGDNIRYGPPYAPMSLREPSGSR